MTRFMTSPTFVFGQDPLCKRLKALGGIEVPYKGLYRLLRLDQG